MELTAELFFLGSIFTGVLTLLVLEIYTRFRFGWIKPLSQKIKHFTDKKGSEEQISEAIESFVHIGALASNANEIMADESLFNGLLSTLANRIMNSFKMSMMGTASGDVKKMAKAERLVNEALIEGVKQMSPWISIALKTTGLDEELKEDPEMFGLIMQVLSQNQGLMGMLGNISGLEGIVPSSQEGEAAVRQAIKDGIDF